MKNNILKYGSIAGLVLAVFMFTSFFLKRNSCAEDMGTGIVLGYAAMLLSMGICMFLALNGFYKNNTLPSMGKTMLLCLGIGGMASLIYVIGWAFTYKFVVPDFATKYLGSLEQMVQKGKMTKAELDEAVSMMKDYDKPVYFVLYTLMEIAPVAIFLGLLLPLTTRFYFKKKYSNPV